MVKGPHSDAEAIGLIPGQETKIAVGQLRLCASTREAPRTARSSLHNPNKDPVQPHTQKTPIQGESMKYQYTSKLKGIKTRKVYETQRPEEPKET